MNATQTDTKNAVEWFNRFLRGELSAVETYDQALSKFGKGDGKGVADLRQLRDDHASSVSSIREHVKELGGTPDATSGAWGTWATAVEGAAQLFGNTAALKALKEGEEHGIHDYERGLDDKDLPAECKARIRQLLVPCRAHISTIDRLMAS